MRERVVIDTNILVSTLLRFHSTAGRAFRRVLASSILLVSEATMSELADVLAREKFDPYVTVKQRKAFLVEVAGIAEWVGIVEIVRECRDPKDNMFLELALNGRANVIITGDEDLLVLNPWRKVPILSLAEYLDRA